MLPALFFLPLLDALPHGSWGPGVKGGSEMPCAWAVGGDGDSEGYGLNMHFCCLITAPSVAEGTRGLLVQLILTAVHALASGPGREFDRAWGRGG